MAQTFDALHPHVPHAAAPAPPRATSARAHRDGLVRQAYGLLRWTLVALCALAGADKFAGVLAEWGAYVAPQLRTALPFASTRALLDAAGVAELAIAALVAWRPSVGAYAAATWLGAVGFDLVMIGSYGHALEAFALAISALALANLSPLFAEARSSSIRMA